MAVIIVENGSGLATANSYATTAQADAYHVDILHGSAWASAADPEAALIMATRLLDEKVAWKGVKKTKEQALRWPRSYVYDADGYLVDNDIIPQWLINATSGPPARASASSKFLPSWGVTPNVGNRLTDTAVPGSRSGPSPPAMVYSIANGMRAPRLSNASLWSL